MHVLFLIIIRVGYFYCASDECTSLHFLPEMTQCMVFALYWPVAKEGNIYRSVSTESAEADIWQIFHIHQKHTTSLIIEHNCMCVWVYVSAHT